MTGGSTRVILDARGWRQVAERLDALAEDLEQISAQSQQRLREQGGAGAVDAQVVLMLVEKSPAVGPGGSAVIEHRPARRRASSVPAAADRQGRHSRGG